MKRSQRIKTIVDIKQTQEQKALEELGGAQRRRQDMQNKLQDLQQYREEYQQQYMALGNNGVSINRLLDFRAFVSKLDKAIAEQQVRLQQIDHELQRKRQSWEQAHYKTRSLQKVHDRVLRSESMELARQEQKDQDENASRGGRKVP